MREEVMMGGFFVLMCCKIPMTTNESRTKSKRTTVGPFFKFWRETCICTPWLQSPPLMSSSPLHAQYVQKISKSRFFKLIGLDSMKRSRTRTHKSNVQQHNDDPHSGSSEDENQQLLFLNSPEIVSPLARAHDLIHTLSPPFVFPYRKLNKSQQITTTAATAITLTATISKLQLKLCDTNKSK